MMKIFPGDYITKYAGDSYACKSDAPVQFHDRLIVTRTGGVLAGLVDPVHGEGVASFANRLMAATIASGFKYNADFVVNDRGVFLRARVEIDAGEELFVPYNW